MVDPTKSPPAMPPELTEPSLYINRELSWLAFNQRVLEQAKDERIPLLERLRFLTISSTNLDEFFEIRVAGLLEKHNYKVAATGPDGLTSAEQLSQISQTAHELVDEQYRVLNEVLLPSLAQEGIRLLKRGEWSARQRRFLRQWFSEQILPILTPLGLDPSHPFPKVLNKGLNFLISLEGRDAFGRNSGTAVVQVPRCLPRIIELPPEISSDAHPFVLLSSVIHEHVDSIFVGMKVLGAWQFRVTRNSDLWVDEEEVVDLMSALKGELPSRRYGDAVRLEVADNCPEKQVAFLLRQFGMSPRDCYQVNGPVNLHRIAALVGEVDRADLKYPPFQPRTPKQLEAGTDLFKAIRHGDILVHHPYESFNPIIELVRQAAADPEVLAIKQTLYRTGASNPLVDALYDAAIAGKEVTVVVELRARFDEAANIELATRLQEAGANVVYGVVGFKTHAKMLLIVRREGRRLRRFVHLSTGNYHHRTARAYTDFGYFTANKEVGEDVHQIFTELTGLGSAATTTRLREAPFTMQQWLVDMFEFEAAEARAGRPAWIRARMNSLSEPDIMLALYKASQAGVKIDLVVRGICRLRPGVPGVSENIRVISVIGRFLEHSRVWAFHHGGTSEVWCSSADWMYRNLSRRVEVAFPIRGKLNKERALEESLGLYLEDDVGAWELGSNGTYARRAPVDAEHPRSAQLELLATLAG